MKSEMPNFPQKLIKYSLVTGVYHTASLSWQTDWMAAIILLYHNAIIVVQHEPTYTLSTGTGHSHILKMITCHAVMIPKFTAIVCSGWPLVTCSYMINNFIWPHAHRDRDPPSSIRQCCDPSAEYRLELVWPACVRVTYGIESDDEILR